MPKIVTVIAAGYLKLTGAKYHFHYFDLRHILRDKRNATGVQVPNTLYSLRQYLSIKNNVD